MAQKELTASAQKTFAGLGIDWRALLVKLGPVLLEILASLLAGAAPKAKASVEACIDCCHTECLDAAIAAQVTSLGHLAHLRSCCEVAE